MVSTVFIPVGIHGPLSFPFVCLSYPFIRMANSSRALWKLPEMSMESEGANIGSIRARFNMSGNSAGSPTTVTAHFGCDGSTLSGAEMELVSPGYRTSLVKRRFVAGTFHFALIDRRCYRVIMSCFFCFLRSIQLLL